jgi:uncharacterized protein (TIGR03067 family)
MHGGRVTRKLPARPNLDHLRSQAKTLLGQLNDGDPSAAKAFIDHLPEAKRMKAAAVRAAGFRLADAQSVIARRTGFAGWPALSRHVQQLRALEGEWHFESLEIEGQAVPASMLGKTRLLLDGDRFRSESPEATYEGLFTIDVEASPATIDIGFVEGPDAGNTCYGIYEIQGDSLRLCLGLVDAPRPAAFVSRPGSGHALERLRRVSAARPANVTGGTPPPLEPEIEPEIEPEHADPSAFDAPLTPMMRRLEGEWLAVELISDGKPMPEEWLPYGSRTMRDAEVTVTFGGQTMVHAKVRLDETATPIAIDYLQIDGRKAGTVTRGIMEWIGEEVRFLMPPAGRPRPDRFDPLPEKGTLSRWRRK